MTAFAREGRLLMLSVTVLIACRPTREAPSSRVDAHRHPAGDDSLMVEPCAEFETSIVVSQESIGPLRLDAPLSSLRARCPSAFDSQRYGENYAYPAVTFPFRRFEVIAVQYRDTLRPDEPAEVWIVRGPGIDIPGGVSGAASWRTLTQAYGDSALVRSTSEFGVTVMFCAIPGYLIKLDQRLTRITGVISRDVSWIDDDAKIKEIMLIPGLPGWSC